MTVRMIRIGVLIATLAGGADAVLAQKYPVWERLLSHYSGTTDATPVPSMKMGAHMQMSLPGKPQPGDAQREAHILAAAHSVVSRYRDVDTAIGEGYKPFYPTGRIGEEIH